MHGGGGAGGGFGGMGANECKDPWEVNEFTYLFQKYIIRIQQF